MADTSRLRSALTAAKSTLTAYPQSLYVTSRAGSSTEVSVGRSTGLYASLDKIELHAAIVDTEMGKFEQLMSRRGVSDARKFAAATSVLRVYRETGMLQFIQELCYQLSSVCSDFSRYSVRLRLTIFTWVRSSIQWTVSVLGVASGNADRLFEMLREGTHGQTDLSSSHSELPLQTLHDLANPPLLRALLGAFAAVRATMDQAVADVHSMHRYSSPMDFYTVYGSLVSSCARSTLILTNQISMDVQKYICRLFHAGSNSPCSSSGSSAPPRPHLLPYIATQLDALLQTGWLSGLCAAVVDMPHPDARLSKRSRDRHEEAQKLEEAMGHAHEAAACLDRVMADLYDIIESIQELGTLDRNSARGGGGVGGRDGGGGSGYGNGSGGTPTAAPKPGDLLSSLLHRVCGMLLQLDVVRLQRVGLWRLAVHAGLGLGGGDDDSSSGGGEWGR